ncbi:hypothetical protein QQS21_011604 [Conoideocrella luteorostrata]|uniref:Lytic polysaccharide monooxygenase n=1 Tax=Conoideocrella luteorostrata TaxID=1105319 RepID=A0AAJ0CD41_9HYPO|nr:hypothetical protein QQS21_011604 [Conoideocrella luteorostrata]
MHFLSILGLAALTSAHMQMSYPPPFRSKHNPYTTDVDYSMTSPLESSGSNFPCKGYHKLLNTPQGKSVATWQAGQSYSITVEGSATHSGGSCQVSLSYDGGSSWKAIHSYIGGCPLTPNWEFTLPDDTPSGDALFAWSWFNKVGNREMYMNCAHITINGARKVRRSPSDPLSSRPAMFVANVNNGCGTLEGADVLFPNPGPDVDNISQKTADPVGSNCE